MIVISLIIRDLGDRCELDMVSADNHKATHEEREMWKAVYGVVSKINSSHVGGKPTIVLEIDRSPKPPEGEKKPGGEAA